LRGMMPELLSRIRQATGDEIHEIEFTAR